MAISINSPATPETEGRPPPVHGRTDSFQFKTAWRRRSIDAAEALYCLDTGNNNAAKATANGVHASTTDMKTDLPNGNGHAEPEHKFIIAVDFGTTYSGYDPSRAYTTVLAETLTTRQGRGGAHGQPGRH